MLHNHTTFPLYDPTALAANRAGYMTPDQVRWALKK
jgi:hypothetical protein